MATHFDGSVGLHSIMIGAEHGIHDPARWNEVDYMANAVNSHFTQTPISLTQDGHNGTNSTGLVASIENNDIYMTQAYVFHANPQTPNSGVDFQASISQISTVFGDIIRSIRNSNPNMDLYGIVQTQESDPAEFNFRHPTEQEMLLNVNLCLAYGARAIIYYLYAATLDEIGLLDATRNPTTQYYQVQNINLII